MITLLSPHYVEEETTRTDLAIAAMAAGFTLGFGFLTTWTALKQTTDIARRYGIAKLKQPYIWMIWSEIFVCVAYGVLSWLHLVSTIPASFAFFFCILTFWALQVHFLLQIIINRIAILLPDPRKATRLKIAVALFITAINISVYSIWVPARLQISERYIHINHIWDRIEKVLYLLTDATLNFYFIRTVQKRLVEQGLQRYSRVVRFNKMIIGFSLSMDCLIIGMMSWKNSFVYMQFHPLAYIVKLNIEMSMANLIVKVSQDTENVKQRRAALNGDIQYPLIKRRSKTATYSGNSSGLTRFASIWDQKSSRSSVSALGDESCELTRMDSQTWRKHMGRYKGRFRYDIRAHTKTEVTFEEREKLDVGGSSVNSLDMIGSAWPLNNVDSGKQEALENSRRLGLSISMGVHTEIRSYETGGASMKDAFGRMPSSRAATLGV